MTSLQRRSLVAQDISSESFASFGQVIWAEEDGKAFDHEDAQLKLDQGTPRFYIMRLEDKPLRFSQITHHKQCTQCLGALEGLDWYMAVAPAEAAPDESNLRAFRIPGNCFVKLEPGTWHAGPYFVHPAVSFYNLELSDTNVVDHHTHHFDAEGVEFEIMP